MSWFLLAIVGVLGLYLISLYNGLVRKRQMVNEGWSGIDVQLKRRTDLIPSLVEVVKGYASHEREALEAVTRMRSQAEAVPGDDIEGRAKAEGMLSQALGRLMAVAESYPDLKASQNFVDLQASLDKVEHELQMSRRYYNGAVRGLNVAVESFPSNLVARNFGFEKAGYFEIEDAADRSVPSVSF
ncbi:LemA family protein [Roseibium suaedae]|uniref:LemA protein n=1 Tax=Roseibium suaedae TaxID=735517 RepID=A0A1M7B155_9HYPH|nr:LemA family protein [Roseibium suaedae]SHL48748.1 LemA protein [Roseibium suaedae]